MENKTDSRFAERKAFQIGFDDFVEVMQELLDDSTVGIEADYPVLSVCSQWHDCIYDEDEIMERLSAHLGVNVVANWVYVDMREIYFICE